MASQVASPVPLFIQEPWIDRSSNLPDPCHGSRRPMWSGGLILLPHAIVSGIRGTSSLPCSSSAHKSNQTNCSGSPAGAERVWIFGCWNDSSVRTGSPALLTSLPAPRDKEIQHWVTAERKGLSSKDQVHRSQAISQTQPSLQNASRGGMWSRGVCTTCNKPPAATRFQIPRAVMAAV